MNVNDMLSSDESQCLIVNNDPGSEGAVSKLLCARIQVIVLVMDCY